MKLNALSTIDGLISMSLHSLQVYVHGIGVVGLNKKTQGAFETHCIKVVELTVKD